MNDILKEIVANKKLEVAAKASLGIYRDIINATDSYTRKTVSMSNALAESSTGIIAEFKRRSPSKCGIHPAADVSAIVPAYQAAGATACSVLTDTRFFGGSLHDLAIARATSTLPLLRKDFIVDELQIFEARLFGADAILLIASILSFNDITRFTALAHSLGLEVLLEIHDMAELDRIVPEVDMVGINNRNLATFVTDISTSLNMAASLPPDIVKVAESGLSSMQEVQRLREVGFSGFLIGETFMKHKDPANALNDFFNEH